MTDRIKYEHPSYGRVVVRNPRGGRDAMFGSDVPHGSTIRIQLETATMERTVGSQWIFGDKIIADFEMTETQWAKFVASGGSGEGTPVTLRLYRESPGLIAADSPPVIPSHHEHLKDDFTKRAADVAQKMDDVLTGLHALMDQKSIKKGDVAALLAKMAKARQDVQSNLPFVAECFDRQTEAVLNNAQGEMEAYWGRILHAFGEDAAKIILEREMSKNAGLIEQDA